MNIYEGTLVMVIFCAIASILLVTIFAIVISMKNFVIKKDKMYDKKYNDMQESVREIKSLFTTEVAKVLDAFNKILKKKI
jgi:hypothetical protein